MHHSSLVSTLVVTEFEYNTPENYSALSLLARTLIIWQKLPRLHVTLHSSAKVRHVCGEISAH